MEEVEQFLKNIGVGQRPVKDPFFQETYQACKFLQRLGVTVEDDEKFCHDTIKEFACHACQERFENLVDYELHYHNSHHFVCAQCKKWRPSSQLLEIHIQETHDSFFKVLAEKQPMYRCFVSTCKEKFKNSQERKDHCVEVHAYPRSYRFYFNDESKNLKNAIETEKSMEVDDKKGTKMKDTKIYFENSKQKTFGKKKFVSKPVTSIVPTCDSAQTEKKLAPVTMFVPRQVQRKSYAKTLTTDKKMEINALESGSMMELVDSLPKV